jgi:MFS family permease
MRFIEQTALPAPIKRSLDYSWKEGAVTQLMITIFDFFLIPYALYLGATAQQIGFVVALPNICVALSQLAAPWVVRHIGSRVRALVIGISVHAVVLVCLALLEAVTIGNKVWFMIVLVSLFRIVGSVVGPAWGSLIADYLPEDLRGRYTGFRSRVVGTAGLAGLFLWGALLHYSEANATGLGFFALFMLAAVLRTVAAYLVSRMTDMPVSWGPESSFSFWMFIRRFRESNFVKFIFYVASITFATQLAAPYMNVHLLENLKFTYAEYTTVHASGMVAALLGYAVWGRHADVIGNAKVLKFIGYLLPVFPFLWTFARLPWEFVLIEASAGFLWAGFNLCAMNFIYDAVSPPKRIRCLSYFNLIVGLSIFAGAALGGYLVDIVPPLTGYTVLTVFLISGVLRYLSYFIMAEEFNEVRAGAQERRITNTSLLFSVLGFRPLAAKPSLITEPEP